MSNHGAITLVGNNKWTPSLLHSQDRFNLAKQEATDKLRLLSQSLLSPSPSHRSNFSVTCSVLAPVNPQLLQNSCFALLCIGMSISAVFDESVVNSCTSVFSCFMFTQVTTQTESEYEGSQQGERGRQAQEISHTGSYYQACSVQT